MAAKVTRWLIFTIAFSLVPIAASYILAISKNTAHSMPPLSSALEHGELYLLSSTFAAAGLGEVIGDQRFPIARLITSGFSVINIGLSTILFAFSNNATGTGVGAFWAQVSYPIFVFSCVVATTCIFLSELKDA